MPSSFEGTAGLGVFSSAKHLRAVAWNILCWRGAIEGLDRRTRDRLAQIKFSRGGIVQS